MKTFVTRSLSATVFAVVMLGGMLWNLFSFTILFLVINAGALWEYYTMVGGMYSPGKISNKAYRIIGVVIGSVVYMALHAMAHHGVSAAYPAVLILSLLFTFFIMELYSGSERGIVNCGLNVLGIFYISVSLGLLHYLIISGPYFYKWFPDKIWLVMSILFMVWANDTFAYIGGSLLGRRKLFPSISPGKSWEGFITGIAGSILVAYLISLFDIDIALENLIVIAVIVSVAGTFGDLFESMIKRNAGVKDSGAIMPGHGGFLDRFDAFIFCIPFVYAYISLFHVNFHWK